MILQKLKNAITKLRIKWLQCRRRRRLRHTDFSIISNNCWAGTAVYQWFGLKYNTPTVGLGFVDDDYIKFLENLEYYLSLTPVFINPKEASDYELRKKLKGSEIDYPVAKLDDITIWFSHYHSKEEAFLKWERRKKRINFNRLLIKWSQRYNQDSELVQRFLKLPYASKIAFVEAGSPINNPQVVKVPGLEELNIKGGDETEYTLRHIDIDNLLNSIE